MRYVVEFRVDGLIWIGTDPLDFIESARKIKAAFRAGGITARIVTITREILSAHE